MVSLKWPHFPLCKHRLFLRHFSWWLFRCLPPVLEFLPKHCPSGQLLDSPGLYFMHNCTFYGYMHKFARTARGSPLNSKLRRIFVISLPVTNHQQTPGARDGKPSAILLGLQVDSQYGNSTCMLCIRTMEWWFSI